VKSRAKPVNGAPELLLPLRLLPLATLVHLLMTIVLK
jgi:hypothetical protein